MSCPAEHAIGCITQKSSDRKNTEKRMMEYHIIPSTLCHDTVSRYKTIKSDGSDGLENHLTGRRQRVKGSFVPKHSLKCNFTPETSKSAWKETYKHKGAERNV